MSLHGPLHELQRRGVYRVATAYAAAAFVLAQVADLFLPRLGMPDWTVTVVVALCVLGFPVALVLAWAFDLTPEGLRRAEPAPAEASLPPLRARSQSAAFAAGAAVVLSLGGLFWIGAHASAPRIERVAVLPLINLTGDPEQEYFVEGMHDALISELAYSGVRVIARRSVMRFRDTDQSIAEIARQLDVDALVEASLMRVDDKVRIQARLIDAQSEEQRWAHTYDSELSNVLAMHRQLTRAVADEMRLSLSQERKARLASARPVDPEAYELYLKGMHLLNRYTTEGFTQGLALLHQAVEKDPANPFPYAGLALGYSLIGHGPGSPVDAYARARAAVERALELDPDFAEAHAALAETRLYRDYDYEGARASFERALELNPSLPNTHSHYGWYLALIGRMDDAAAEMRQAQEIDPLTPLHTAFLAWLETSRGNTAVGIAEARKALEINPRHPMALYVLGLAYSLEGRHDEAIAAGTQAGEASFDWLWGLGQSYARAGRREDALRIAERIEERATTWHTWGLADIYADLGDTDRAMEWLQRAYDERHSYAPWIGWNPAFAALRRDPRYLALADRLELPALYLAHGVEPGAAARAED